MEYKNELSDIILEKYDNKSIKSKRILVIVALLIVVFLVVLVVMKAINKPIEKQDNTKLVLLLNSTEKKIEDLKKEDDIFKQIPIVEEDKKESFEEMVKSLKETKKQDDIKPIAKKVATTPIIKEKPKTIKIPKVTKLTTKPKKKSIKSSIDNTLATTGVYVQVGATSRLAPDKKFLALLASKNYRHKLLPIDIKGKRVTKILIGPYPNSTVAKSVLYDIKSNINKDAFIYKVK